MPSLVELATEMVITRGKTTPLTAEEMINELNMFHTALKKLESGEAVTEQGTEEAAPEAPAPPTLSLKKAFGKNEVICMICGKGGFKTLGRHLATAHGMKPREYKKQFGIPASQSLSAKAYSESRRQMAKDRGLGGNLAKAREVRMANIEAGKAAPSKAKAGGKKTK
jgi:predicted transcriptional regulator